MSTTATTTAMFHTGATTRPMPGISVQPGREMTDDQLEAMSGLEGLNATFVADVLSDMLMHERCGFHLYRSLEGRSNNPMLAGRYRDFGKDTARHIAVLEELITALGGDPQYVSPSARATEKMNTALLESTFMLDGSIDVMTAELVMLDAVLLAETRDHANWSCLSDLVTSFPEGKARDAVRKAVIEVEDEEDTHLDWARSTRSKMIALQSSSSAVTAMGAKAEEVMAKVKNLFD